MWILIAYLLTLVHGQTFQCLDDSGNTTDWWVMMKFPNGDDYAFTSSSEPGFVEGKGSFGNATGAFGWTVRQLYQHSSHDNLGYTMYNDQSPDGSSHDSRAHAKGIVAADTNLEVGFWLIHSMPKFPPAKADGWSGGIPSNTYGQSIVCVSLGIEQLDAVADQMKVAWPFTYDSFAGQNVESELPSFADWINNDKRDRSVNTSIADITTLGGARWRSVIKNKKWGLDLFEDLVAPALGANFWTNTWQNGPGKIPSYCNPQYKYQIENIVSVSVVNQSWKSTQDHSKWAVSSSPSALQACIGDINRQEGQRNRGGGMLCLQSQQLWLDMQKMVISRQECDNIPSSFHPSSGTAISWTKHTCGVSHVSSFKIDSFIQVEPDEIVLRTELPDMLEADYLRTTVKLFGIQIFTQISHVKSQLTVLDEEDRFPLVQSFPLTLTVSNARYVFEQTVTGDDDETVFGCQVGILKVVD